MVLHQVYRFYLLLQYGFKFSANDFFNTSLVCGIAPSNASTNKSTPSTVFNTLSTSPPKSACPGVSTMLILHH